MSARTALGWGLCAGAAFPHSLRSSDGGKQYCKLNASAFASDILLAEHVFPLVANRMAQHSRAVIMVGQAAGEAMQPPVLISLTASQEQLLKGKLGREK